MFPELEQARAHLTPFPGRYWIAGGWAVDLHAGSQTRVHKDVEIAIARQDQSLLWQLPDLARIDYIETRVAKPWNGEEIKLPVHEVYCHFNAGYILEILLNEFDETSWLYRRNKKINLPRDKFPPNGAPLPLEIVLLFKSAPLRDIDEHDFTVALPLLSNREKTWLHDAVALENVRHPWLARL
tara:strand:- start:82 stop:630 length:549 start_codon:yes stop_codon:yes gene_type:complete